MSNITIPLKSDLATAATYENSIDAKYKIFMAELKNYPVPNVYAEKETYSQEAWGLTLGSRSTQNQIWKDAYALNLSAGNGELNTYSFTAPFVSKIKKILQWKVKTAAYFEGEYNNDANSFLTFDGTAGRIASRTGTPHSLSLYDTGTQYGAQKKAFIGTAGGNKFLIYAGATTIRTVPCDANGIPTGTGIGTALASNDLGNGCKSGSTIVIGAVANKFWVYYIAAEGKNGGQFGYTRVKTRGSLYTLNSNGTITLVGHGAIQDTGQGSNGYVQSYHNITGSYFHSNGHAYVHLYGLSHRQNGLKQLRVISDINCNVTNSFSESIIRSAQQSSGIPSGSKTINVGWTGSRMLYTRGTTIYEMDASVDQSTGQTCAGDYLYPFAFCETVSKMSTSSQNIIIPSSNDRFTVYGTDVNGTISGIGGANSLFVYEVDTSTSQDNGFKGIYLKAKAVDQNGFTSFTQLLKLYLNDVLAQTVGIISEDGMADPNTIGTSLKIDNEHQEFVEFTLTNQEINDYKAKLQLKLEKNGSVQPAKIAFGATGGTYAAPTGNYEVSSLTIQL